MNWLVHPCWQVIQGAFTLPDDKKRDFNKLVRKKRVLYRLQAVA